MPQGGLAKRTPPFRGTAEVHGFALPTHAKSVGGRPSLAADCEFGYSSTMTRVGFYSGSFDPVTLGHTDVIARSARLVDRLVIGVGVHASKAPLFTAAERVEMLKAETRGIAEEAGVTIEVVTFADLAVTAARAHGATLIIRGLRDGTDFDYEMQMAGMNGAMAPEVQTVFVAASPAVRHIAANLVRQIALMGGEVSSFVSPEVARRLAAKARARGE